MPAGSAGHSRRPSATWWPLLWVDGRFLVLTEYGKLLLIQATPERFEKLAEMDLSDGNMA